MAEHRIHVRVSQKEKEELAGAATSRGKTLTSFMLEAALKEAKQPIQELGEDEAIFTGIPSFMAANLHEAKRGGAGGYQKAGWHFAIHICNLVPNGAAKGDWLQLVETEFRPILEALPTGQGNDPDLDAVHNLMKWMKEHFPKIAEQIPTRRLSQFALGLIQAHEEDRVF